MRKEGPVIRPIVGWHYEGKLLSPAQAEKMFKGKLYGWSRPDGLIPVYDTIGEAVAAA